MAKNRSRWDSKLTQRWTKARPTTETWACDGCGALNPPTVRHCLECDEMRAEAAEQWASERTSKFRLPRRFAAGLLLAAGIALGAPSAWASCNNANPYPFTSNCLPAADLNNAFTNAYSNFAGPTQPTAPIQYQQWLNTSTSPPTLEVWTGSQWVIVAAVTSSQYVPPIGGGIGTISSSATTDIGSVPEAVVTVTGVATISSLGTSILPGQIKYLIISSGLTFTYSSPGLVIPGAADLAAAAGSVVVVVSTGVGTASVLAYVPTTAPVVPGPGGSSGQVQYNNSGSFGGFTASGDATINTGTGAVTVAKVNGTSVPATPSADQTLLATATSTGAWKSLPNCTDTAGQHLNYGTATHVFSCGTSTIGSGVVTVTRQVFTSTGTYTPHAGMLYADIEVVGGGGGGGGAASGITGVCSGAGGGAGGYSRRLVSAATVGASQAVTIGAAGAGGTNVPGNGGNGGTTSVGALLQATGGTGGVFVASNASYFSVGGDPGVGSGGDDNYKGEGGGATYWTGAGPAIGGKGGNSFFGGGGLQQVQTTAGATSAGVAGGNYGAGGSGGISTNAAGGVTGGAGTAGYVSITEYNNQ